MRVTVEERPGGPWRVWDCDNVSLVDRVLSVSRTYVFGGIEVERVLAVYYNWESAKREDDDGNR